MKEKAGLIQSVGNFLFMLLVLVFVVDPTSTIFGVKNVVFALLFLYSLVFFKVDWSKLVYFLIPVIAVTLSWILALIRGHHVDADALKDIYIAFVPLLMLLWIDHYNVIRLSVIPVTLAALIVLLLFWLIFFFNQLEGPIYVYMGLHDDTIMMSNRVFLGVKLFCMYPKSTAAFLPVFGYALYNSLRNPKGRIMNIIITFVLLHMFLISGTRSSVMLPVLLVGAIVMLYCRNGRYMRYIVYPAFLVFGILFFLLLAMLLMEENEPSNMVKYAHLTSYKELFEQNPIYLILGQGPATEFYSAGFRRMTMQTEWTYLEFVRNYGVLCLPILYVIVRPMVTLLKLAGKNESTLAIALAYMIYLVIAGTNPLLLSSTGMLVLLSAFSYAEHNKVGESEK